MGQRMLDRSVLKIEQEIKEPAVTRNLFWLWFPGGGGGSTVSLLEPPALPDTQAPIVERQGLGGWLAHLSVPSPDCLYVILM